MRPEPEGGPGALADDWLALKDAVKRFERAWREGPRPAIDPYLPAALPLRRRVLIELAHIDMELRLKAGEPARAEEYLGRYPELAQDRVLALELISAEHDLRRRHERGLSLDDYAQRFPEFRAELSERIARPTAVAVDTPFTADSGPEAAPQVPGYEVQEQLGRGGMGVVYRARQHSLDRPVALKFLPRGCAHDPEWLARFRREARTASALNHPNICTIYDTGEAAGRPYLSMELVHGKTLEALIGEQRPVEEVAAWLAQAARAVAAAHSAGVVHRDIKPANLMVRDDGIVKVLDFGLARQVGAARPRDGESGCPSTDPGTRVGTLHYMSPEQVRAEPVNAATDIFSLGLVLYELLTGQHPFHADSEVGVLHGIVAEAAVPPSRLNPEIPGSLNALIQHMLTKDWRLRPTATDVDAALTQLSIKSADAPASQQAGPARHPMVGRKQEWARLRRGLEEAAAGRGLILCVSGEPGLGKTTLVESFLEELAATGRTWSLARGRCSERLAGAEAYLPFLEALDSLLQGEHGAAAAQAMKLLAPTWYVQLVPLAADDPSLERVLAEAKAASQERRKRELAVFLQEMSRQHPLVVFLDDVHWVDPSSVDLLAYLGSKCAAWRLLLVLTYRPSELLRSEHPFGAVKLELQGRGVCREITLHFLRRKDVDRYLALAFAGHDFPEELAAVLHARTEGNPLFMVDLLCYLRDRGVIVLDDGRWTLARAVPDLRRELPESVRGMIQRKVDQLSTADRQLLMAASVQGTEFDALVVARLLGREAADVEERLDALARVHMMVRLVREQTFPDGTLTLHYGFVHVLYQNALYDALQPTRKATWSAAAAKALLDHYGEKSAGRAAELAVLFEAARDHGRAADFYLQAAQNDARLFAHQEAMALARRGLAVLEKLPDSAQRARRELGLQFMLGVQMQIARGYATPEAERSYARARALCDQVPDAPELFLVVRGLWAFHLVGSELTKAREFADSLFGLAQRSGHDAHMLQGHQALAVTSFFLGEPAATRQHMELTAVLYDPRRHAGEGSIYGQDPGVVCLAFGAVALWLLGYPDQAVQRSREAVALAGQLGQPGTLVLALHFGAMLRQYRRENVAVQGSTEASAAVSAEHGYSLWLAGARMMRGWALAEEGKLESGIAELQQGLADWTATGARTSCTYYMALLAEALGKDGRLDETLEMLAQAEDLMRGRGEGFHGAELQRLRGEFLLRRDPSLASGAEAEACFRQALTIAQQQRARSLELRAAMSLARLDHQRGGKGEGRALLARCYDSFTEGLDTADLKDASALLDQVG
jgi:predicted ATPase